MSDGQKYTDAEIARQMVEGVTGRQVQPWEATATAAVAQVHATLALVEQQRIANLIALFSIENSDAANFAAAGFSYPAAIGEIVEALGLS